MARWSSSAAKLLAYSSRMAWNARELWANRLLYGRIDAFKHEWSTVLKIHSLVVDDCVQRLDSATPWQTISDRAANYRCVSCHHDQWFRHTSSCMRGPLSLSVAGRWVPWRSYQQSDGTLKPGQLEVAIEALLDMRARCKARSTSQSQGRLPKRARTGGLGERNFVRGLCGRQGQVRLIESQYHSQQRSSETFDKLEWAQRGC